MFRGGGASMFVGGYIVLLHYYIIVRAIVLLHYYIIERWKVRNGVTVH